MSNLFQNNIIDPKELMKIHKDPNIRIIDGRWYIDDKKKGNAEFKKNHIPGAIFFNLEFLSNKEIKIPHMLPRSEQFKKFLFQNNISKNNSIIIYDQTGFFCSSRVWFTFKYFGFDNTRILNGGFNLWKIKKFKTSNINKQSKKTIKNEINISANKDMVIDKISLERKILDKKCLILDARSSERFLGIANEPRKGLNNGNIPGSINIHYKTLTDNKGKLVNEQKLKKILKNKNVKRKSEIICTCGSGITACNIFFALHLLNFKKIKLYDGSWAEWGKK